MTREIEAAADGIRGVVVISDEEQALLAAKAAGRAVLGVEGKEGERLWAAPYVVSSWEEVTGELLERILRRRLGLPWHIAQGERLLIRELTEADGGAIPAGEELFSGEAVFREAEGLRAYIKNQYQVWEYGIWAVERREDGCLAGLAGVFLPELSGEAERGLAEWGMEGNFLELGYRIFAPYRGRGYGREACGLIRDYAHKELGCGLLAVIEESNKASRRLAESLGFKLLLKAEGALKAPGAGTLSAGRRLLYGERR